MSDRFRSCAPLVLRCCYAAVTPSHYGPGRRGVGACTGAATTLPGQQPCARGRL
ncbi:TonB-dependent receptor [Anopheles sinensis]|uniref:TonB-dependent receptor n=1 Tax=Anopheles sinensis TaxID=74873 RepID=A0A084WJF4_ANOSI|nr:TonB-dependent receptor [Anopheles sinensis]